MFEGIDKPPDRIDNISDTALHAFREHYNDDTITKDAIFDYVYGDIACTELSGGVCKRFIQNDTAYPVCTGFSDTFAAAGVALADLHLNYETCERYPLELVFAHAG